MQTLAPKLEFSPQQYLTLLALLILASVCNPVLGWLFPAIAGSVWLTVLPPLVGIYQLLLFFRNLGIINLPNAAYYSALLTPLFALSFYSFVLH